MKEVTLPVYFIGRHRMAIDGEGVTSLVASIHCPLNCKYCLNPQMNYEDTKYKLYTPKDLYDAVKVDDLYFQATGGGITFGGGESLLYGKFIREFKKIANPQWKINIESSLNISSENLLEVIDIIDEFIVDIKDMNTDIYLAYTDRTNKQVISNLKLLVEKEKQHKVLIRVPLIPEYNSNQDVEKSVEELKKMGFSNIVPFTYIKEIDVHKKKSEEYYKKIYKDQKEMEKNK